jgi:hypothetical protein
MNTPLLTEDAFHQHLDRCEQCRTQPFGLCVEGAKMLLDTTDLQPKHETWDGNTRRHNVNRKKP